MAPLSAAATAEAVTTRRLAVRRAADLARQATAAAAAAARLCVVPSPPAEAERPERRTADLYREHGAVVYRRCLRLLGNVEAARDATQEVFLRLVRDEELLADRPDLVPWLYRVATNHCLNLRRDARHHGETPLEDGEEVVGEQAGDALDAIVVQRLLARFDVVTQAIAVAILVDEQEHEDVAAALGLSRRTMARKLERFIELARRHLVLSGDAAAERR
jgi:RNA polymerase sigma-70 factor (ECF subfamily)